MTQSATTWLPQEIDDVLLAFPGSVSHLMPPRDECEAALRAMPDHGRGWREFQRRWFYSGMTGNEKVNLKDGVDGATAFRHLSAIQGSYEPKHEHKEAAVAYLASLWFEAPPKAAR